jgi:hypothetical protein
LTRGPPPTLCIRRSSRGGGNKAKGGAAVGIESTAGFSPDGRVAPLAQVLAYRNDLVVRRFLKRIDIAPADAELVFVELLRWLWYLASTRVTPENPEAHSIDGPMLIIDEMWHEFIVVTQDYTDFCHSAFGYYIHHAPDRGDDAEGRHFGHGGVTSSLAALLGRKRAKYTAIYDALGREVFVRWYLDFPQRFGADAIAQVHGSATSGPSGPDSAPQDSGMEKQDLIEEALLLNLFRGIPDAPATAASGVAA